MHADAAEFVKDKRDQYDVVIIDSTDPVGPAETLFTAGFYQALRGAMRPGAIMCNQARRHRRHRWHHRQPVGHQSAPPDHHQERTRPIKTTMRRPTPTLLRQGECVWLHLDLIGDVLSHCKEVFPSVDYCYTTIPTYPSGQATPCRCCLGI